MLDEFLDKALTVINDVAQTSWIWLKQAGSAIGSVLSPVWQYLIQSKLLLLFLLFVFAGMIIAFSTFFTFRNGKKHGFRQHRYYGMSQRIDKKVSQVYQGNEDYVPYHDADQLEQHANKKWKTTSKN